MEVITFIKGLTSLCISIKSVLLDNGLIKTFESTTIRVKIKRCFRE
jgi:hypothetical protein